MNYTLKDEKMKIGVRENHTVENEDILMFQFKDCITSIHIYEMFNNNIHLLNMLL